MAKCWFNEERYDDDYKEIHINCPRGVDGVMLPNNLTDAGYEKYVNERNGKVTTYSLKGREVNENSESLSEDHKGNSY